MRRPPVPPPLRVSLLLLAATACGTPASDADAGSRRGDTLRVTDQAGVEHAMASPASRVVSLVPSATLALDALGARDALVGRTDFDTVTWAADLPSVGGGLEPSVESLVALEPDLVIRFAGPQDPETPARLDDLGIRHVAVRPDGVGDVLDMISLVGAVVGRSAAADSLVAGLRAELAAVREAGAERPRRRVAYVLGGTPPWVAGPRTHIHELIELAGGENVFADLSGLYGAVSPEEFVARRIDVVLVPDASTFDASLVPDARVEEVGGAVELPGPGVAEAARQILHLIHGEGR